MIRASRGVVLAMALTACGGVASTVGQNDAGGDASSGSSGSASGSGASSGSASGATSGSSGATSGSSGGSGSTSGSSGGSGSASGSSGGSGGSGSSSGSPVDGGACTTNAQCGVGMICGFRSADGCTATGSCFPAPGVTCQAFSPGCACDGTEVNVACNGLPGGYASKPLLHTGACGRLDAGAACTSDTQCSPGLKCCYPCGTPGCKNECISPTASGACPQYP